MNNEVVLKQGYRLTITTWENDGDNYKHKELGEDGELTEIGIRYILHMLQLFSAQTRSNSPNIGNEEFERLFIHLETFVDHHNDFAKRYNQSGYPIFDAWADDDSENAEALAALEKFIYEYVGDWADGEFVRVFESAKVHYVPKTMVIMRDVTDDFPVS